LPQSNKCNGKYTGMHDALYKGQNIICWKIMLYLAVRGHVLVCENKSVKERKNRTRNAETL